MLKNYILSLSHPGSLRLWLVWLGMTLQIVVITSIVVSKGEDSRPKNRTANVRLSNSPSTAIQGVGFVRHNEGIVEMYDERQKKWGPLACGSGQNDLIRGEKRGAGIAETVCKQLGYNRGYDTLFEDGEEEYGPYDNAYNGYVYIALRCNNTVTHINDCDYSNAYTPGLLGQCYPKQYIAVKCDIGGESVRYTWNIDSLGWLVTAVSVVFFIFVIAYIYDRCKSRKSE